MGCADRMADAMWHAPRQARVLSGLVAVLLVTHLPALLSESTIQDEAVYVVAAREMLAGGRLYVDVIDRKPPLLFWVYQEILRNFGTHNWLALHVVGVIWVLATMGALYLVGCTVAGARAGVVAALLYPVFQTFWDMVNLAFNGEVLMNLPVVLGIAIAFRGRSRWRPELLLAGAMPALGFLLKQPAGIAGLALGIYVLLPGYRRSRGLEWVHSLVHAAWLCLGFAGTFAVAALMLQRQGNFREALYWSVLDHGVTYGIRSAVFWARGGRMTLIFSLCCAPLLFGVVQSLRAATLWTGREAERMALIVFLAVSAVGTAASGRFFDYYYIQLLPPLVLLAAPWFAAAWYGDQRSPQAIWTLRGTVLCAAIFLVVNFIEAPEPLGQGTVDQYIRRTSAAGDRLFVWGQYPKFYLHADLRPASRYIAFFPLTGYIFGSPWNHDPAREDTQARVLPGAWARFEEDIARHPPRYIFDTEAAYYPPKYPIAHFVLLHRLLMEHYRPVFSSPQGLLYQRRTDVDRR